jgi:hypothetical protein
MAAAGCWIKAETTRTSAQSMRAAKFVNRSPKSLAKRIPKSTCDS